MNTAARLSLYGLGLVAVFSIAAAAAGALAPAGIAAEWATSAKETEMQQHDTADAHDTPPTGAEHGGQAEHGGHGAAPTAHLGGLALSENGYTLDAVTAPATAGARGVLSFRILDEHGRAVTAYETEHDKRLHLIVVRADGTQFRHVHPELDADGVWSIDWEWDAAGGYRVYADFAASGAEPVTLSRTVQVAGEYTPDDPQPSRTAQVAGYEVTLSGDLVAGAASDLTVSVSRDGAPVTDLAPYLGAYGHLVALRQGDLGYAHVHPEGEAPRAGDTAGPDVSFAASVPTPGRYLLYFDFRVDDAVHSVPFVIDTH